MVHPTRKRSRGRPVWVGLCAALIMALITGVLVRFVDNRIQYTEFLMFSTLSVVASAYFFGHRAALMAYVASLISYLHFGMPPGNHLLPIVSDTISVERFAGLVAVITVGWAAGVFARRSRRRIESLSGELKESKNRITDIVECMTDAFLTMDKSWRITYVNDLAENILHRERGSLLGKNIWSVFPETVDLAFHREYHRAMKNDIAVDFEEYYRPLNKWFEVHAYPSPHGLTVYFRDITRRKNIEEELNDSKARLTLATEAAEIGTWYWDLVRDVLVWDGKCKELFGLPPNQTVTYNIFTSMLHQEDRERADSALHDALEQHGEYDIEYRILNPDRGEKWIHARGSGVYDERGKAVRMVGIAIDVTDLRHAQDSLLRAEEQKLTFYRRLIEAATNGKLVLTRASEIEKIAQSSLAHWTLSTPRDLAPIRHSMTDLAITQGMDEARVSKFAMCLGEVATNALNHAGGGEISLHRTDDGLMIVAKDGGPGIAALNLPDVALRQQYSTLGTLGMGYKVIISFGDKVYLATGGSGTTVGIHMKYQEEPVLLVQSINMDAI